ncbi:hypothetical protein HPB47_025341 [Ixodes persulcatus]|uniref:Uncharacterized protein n=1 Tax=Ixodes persulcatus TaxID=34615 RepID=A0AC60Q1V5_IXOPE|nr:hypothetical protein HPB47_025341 [Ixodes persulcatus]
MSSSNRLRIDEAEYNQAGMSPSSEHNSSKTSSSSSVRTVDSPIPATASPLLTIQSVRSLSEDAATHANCSSSLLANNSTSHARTYDNFPRFGGKPGRPKGRLQFSTYFSPDEFRPHYTIKACSANGGAVVAKGEHAYAFCDVEHGKAVIETLDRKIAAVLQKTAAIRKKLSGHRTRYKRNRDLLKQLNELREFRKLPKLVFNPSQKRMNREAGAAPVNSAGVTNVAKGSGNTCDQSRLDDDIIVCEETAG